MFSLGSKLSKKFPQLLQFQPGIDFLARLFFIGTFIIIIKKVYSWNATSHGIINFPLLGPGSPIELLRHILLQGTHFILTNLGYPAQIHGWIVGIPGGAIKIETPCLGINVCFVFIALVAAYPSPFRWYNRLAYIAVGLLLIQFLNLCRMVAMVFVVKNRYHLPIEHHDLFNIIIYTFIFSLFYYFTNLSQRREIVK